MAITLALALIMPIIAIAEYDEHRNRMAALSGYLQHFLECDLIGESEAYYFFVHPEQIENDLLIMQWRIEAMKPDCPPRSDIFRLPSREVTYQNWLLAHRYMHRLEVLIPFITPAHWNEIIPMYLEQKRRYLIWNKLDDCYGYNARIHLQELRDLVGRDCYERGEWPEPVIPAAWGPWTIIE